MAVTTTTVVQGIVLIHDATANATPESNVRSGATTVRRVVIGNPNPAAVYFKAYNNTAPTVGTTDPDLILPAAASATASYTIPNGGHTFGTALSFAVVTSAGTGGTSNPATAVLVDIECT